MSAGLYFPDQRWLLGVVACWLPALTNLLLRHGFPVETAVTDMLPLEADIRGLEVLDRNLSWWKRPGSAATLAATQQAARDALAAPAKPRARLSRTAAADVPAEVARLIRADWRRFPRLIESSH